MKTLLLLSLVTFTLTISKSTSAQELDKNYLGAEFMWVGNQNIRDLFKETKVPRPPSNYGIFVASVNKDGPLKDFKAGDILVSIDGKALREEDEAFNILENLEPGEHEIVIQRGQVSNTGRKSWKKETVSMTAGTFREYIAKAMVSSQDDFTNLKVFRHQFTPDSAFGPTTACFLLFKDGNEIKPAIRFQLRTEDWLFVDRVTLLIDAETIAFSKDDCSFKREVITGSRLHEWCTVTGENAEKAMKQLGSAKRIAIRFHGRNLLKDHEFEETELHTANITAIAYRLMKAGK